MDTDPQVVDRARILCTPALHMLHLKGRYAYLFDMTVDCIIIGSNRFDVRLSYPCRHSGERAA
jgi:hypothetical protein